MTLYKVCYAEDKSDFSVARFDTKAGAIAFIGSRPGIWKEIPARGDGDLFAYMNQMSGTILVIRKDENATT